MTKRIISNGLLLLLFFFSTSLLAQSIDLNVKVTDGQNGDPLIGATISLPEIGKGGYSDENGMFTTNIQPKAGQNTVSMKISFTGYANYETQINLTNPEPIYKIELVQEDVRAEDVVITATKGFAQAQSDVTVSIEVLKPRSIQLQALPSVDKALTQIPGVDNQDGQLNIRGSSGYAYGVGSRVMVTLDGLPLLSGDAGGAVFDLIPVDNLAQIEVLKGASSVLYGSSALGGVINVITADPDEKPRTVLRIRGGAFDQPANKKLDWDGDASAKSGSIHLFHSRKIGKLDFTLQANAIKETGYRQSTDQEQYRGLAMLKWKPIKGLTVGLNASISVDSSGQILYWDKYFPDSTEVNGEITYSGGGLTPTTDDGGFRRQLQSSIALDPVIKYLDDNGNLFWYRGRLLRNSNANNTNQSSQYNIFYNDFLYQRTIADKINWVTGATYTFATIDGDSLYGGTYEFEGQQITSDGSHDQNSLGLYTQLDGKFGRLNTSLGVRFESVQIDGSARSSLPVFRAGINYKIAEGTNFRASFGQAFRVPSIAERFANTSGGGVVVEPNPSIRSETGFSAEVGLRQGFFTKQPGYKIKGFVDLAGFRMQYQDMVEFGVSTANIFPELDVRFSSINVADARITGGEATMMLGIEGKKSFFNLSGGVTYIDPQNLNPAPDSLQLDLETGIGDIINLDTKVDQPPILKYRQRWTVRFSGSVGYGPVSFTTNFRYKSFTEAVDQYLFIVVSDLKEFRDLYPNGNRVFDMILAWDINKKNQISLTLDNAFNEEYLVIPGFLAPQRKLTLQYRVEF
ncbi:MAG: TonB-dependent receptor [Bacteroidota bacterium]